MPCVSGLPACSYRAAPVPRAPASPGLPRPLLLPRTRKQLTSAGTASTSRRDRRRRRRTGCPKFSLRLRAQATTRVTRLGSWIRTQSVPSRSSNRRTVWNPVESLTHRHFRSSVLAPISPASARPSRSFRVAAPRPGVPHRHRASQHRAAARLPHRLRILRAHTRSPLPAILQAPPVLPRRRPGQSPRSPSAPFDACASQLLT